MEFSVPKDALREVWFEIDLVVKGFNGPFPYIAFCTSVTDYTYIYILYSSRYWDGFLVHRVYPNMRGAY